MSSSKQVVRIGPLKDIIASGVRVDNLLTLSGQVSLNPEGQVVGTGDIGAQVHQSYINIQDVLVEFGATMKNVVDEMWLVTDIQDVMANINQLGAIRSEVYGRDPEVTQTLIQVSGLVMPELLIEIKCIALV